MDNKIENTSNWNRVIEYLKEINLTSNVAFVGAIIQHLFKERKIFTHPLTAILTGIFPSALYVFGATFVESLLPGKYKLMVPGAIILSTTHICYTLVYHRCISM